MTEFDRPRPVITDIMAHHAVWRPDKTAFVCGERRVSWRDFMAGVNRVANALIGLGIEKGDKVSVLSPNSVEDVEIIFGAIRAGAVIVPLSGLVAPDGLHMMIDDSDSRVLFVAAELADRVRPFVDRLDKLVPGGRIAIGFEAPGWTPYETFAGGAPAADPEVALTFDDDCLLIYSSGTTGTPKGIVHHHFARHQLAHGLGLRFHIDGQAVVVLTTPMYTNGTWVTMLPALVFGGTVVAMPKFDPRAFLEIVARERGTHVFMVPTQFIVTLAEPGFDDYDLGSLKAVISIGSPLRLDTKREVIDRFGCDFYELYGLTEGVGTTIGPGEIETKFGSVGRPYAGQDMRIIDNDGNELPRGEVGEIVGYGAGLMRGYYKKPDKTEEAIWRDERGRTFLRTGDIGRFDEDGYLYLLDRKKDMIISGGINVFPADIEGVVGRHPAVRDVAVIGIPHAKWGETPVALVIREPGATATPDEIGEWANARLGKHQRVAFVEFRDDFPRNAMGKVLKRELRAPYWKNPG